MEWMLYRRRDLYLLILCVSLFFIWIHITHIRSGPSHTPATTAYEQSTIPHNPPSPPPEDIFAGSGASLNQYDGPANATLGVRNPAHLLNIYINLIYSFNLGAA